MPITTWERTLNLSERIEGQIKALKALFEDNIVDGLGAFHAAELALAGIINSLVIGAWTGDDLGALLYALRNESGRLSATATMLGDAAGDDPVPFVPAGEPTPARYPDPWGVSLGVVAMRAGVTYTQAHTALFLSHEPAELRAAIVQFDPMIVSSEAADRIISTVVQARALAGGAA